MGANAQAPIKSRSPANSARESRSGDRLYNAIWRRRFPELADLPRSATGGRPIDGDRVYRLLNLKTSIERRFVFPQVKRLTRGRIDKTEAYFSVDGYVTDDQNAGYLRAALEQRSEIFPPRIGRALRKAYSRRELDSHVLLRAASLVEYLDG